MLGMPQQTVLFKIDFYMTLKLLKSYVRGQTTTFAAAMSQPLHVMTSLTRLTEIREIQNYFRNINNVIRINVFAVRC
jgi:hypothetical protein